MQVSEEFWHLTFDHDCHRDGKAFSEFGPLARSLQGSMPELIKHATGVGVPAFFPLQYTTFGQEPMHGCLTVSGAGSHH